MKRLICLLAALMVIFTACGGNNTNENPDDAKDGVVQDGDGVIDENNSGNDNIIDDAADGAEDIVDGAADATKDVARGARGALDDMTGMNGNNNSRKSMN